MCHHHQCVCFSLTTVTAGSVAIGELQQQQQYLDNISIVCVHLSLTAVTTVSVVLVSVLLISVIIITSIIVWCVMRRRPSSHATATTSTTGTSVDHSDKGVTELAPVIYDTPITQHTITTQHNVAYGGTIPLKQNEAYQQVNIN